MTGYRIVSRRSNGCEVQEIPASVRAELDVTPEWWDAQYRALERQHMPRDLASHDGHRRVESRTLTSLTATVHCVDCWIRLEGGV